MKNLEIERYAWKDYKCRGDSLDIPDYLQAFLNASTAEEAANGFLWFFNTVTLAGGISEAALPVVKCLMSSLAVLGNYARSEAMELLSVIATGVPDSETGDKGVIEDCLREMAKGESIFYALLTEGDQWEQRYSITILLCVYFETGDKSGQEKLLWYIEQLFAGSDDKFVSYVAKAIEEGKILDTDNE